jgi:neopullulanase
MRIAILSSLLGLSLFACSAAPDVGEIESADQSEEFEPTRALSDITFAEGTAFTKRDCSVTVKWAGGGNSVRLAGEFTDWASRAIPLTRTGNGHEVTISPGPDVTPGRVYGYKIVADDAWKLDPDAKYRKIVGGQMNSGLVFPECNAGPEIVSQKVTVQGSTMSVRVTARGAADGSAASKLVVSFDNGAVAAEHAAVSGANVDFTFRGLAKGKHTLSLRAVDVRGREALPIDLPFWVEDEPFDYRDGILYMMVLDRFANGDRSNDRPVGAPVHYDADWHGGDLQGALEVMRSGYFEKLGVRTIWLSPLNTQTNKFHPGDGNQLFSAYHGYWPVQSRGVEPRFGGPAALRAFVKEAHARGLRVLLDLINNQVHEDHEYVQENASWFRRSCKCGDDANGCGWSVRPFDCLFQPYLPDIDWNQPGAEKRFIADASSWISAFDFDGFRVDAVKHVESNSVFNMRAELSRRYEQGGARIFMVGETAVGEFDSGTFFGERFDNGYQWIDAYTGPTALDGQFDFPTRHNMADGLVNGDMPLDQVEQQLRKAETRYRPGSHHVRFLNGHDNPRIASIAAKDGRLGCLWINGCRDGQLPPLAYDDSQVYVKLKRALTVLYTLPGVPYLYAGDEVAFGGGGDPDMRRNMLFGEGLDGVEMTRPGTEPKRLTDLQVDLRRWVRALGAVRAGSRAIRRGDRIPLLGNDGNLWVYAYQTGPTEVAVVVVNRGGAVSRMISARSLSLGGVSTFLSPLGTGALRVDGDRLSLNIGAGEAAIFVAR